MASLRFSLSLLFLCLLSPTTIEARTKRIFTQCTPGIIGANTVYDIGGDIPVTTSTPCLDMNNLANVLIRGNGYTIYSQSGGTGYAIQISQSRNITIVGLNVENLPGVNLVSTAANITVENSTFTNSGGTNFAINLGTSAATLTSTNNAFYGYLNAISGSMSVDIRYNRFYSQSANAINIQSAEFANVVSNQAYNIGENGFQISAQQAYVADNLVSGGQNMYSGFSLIWSTAEGAVRIVTNNIVENTIVVDASTASAFSSANQANSQIIFSNNVVRNITNEDCNAFYAFNIADAQSFWLENNTVSNVRTTTLKTCAASWVSPYFFASSIGEFNNNRAYDISGLYTTVHTAQTEPLLSAIRIYHSSVNISFCTFSDFTGAPFPDCSVPACPPTYAESMAGILVSSISSIPLSTVFITNTQFLNFMGGRGGNILERQSDYQINGGDIYGIYCGNGCTLHGSGIVFQNFTGGPSGKLFGQAPLPCIDGNVELLAGAGTVNVANYTWPAQASGCKSSINFCANITNLSNADLTMDVILSNSTGPVCLTFTNCTNIRLHGAGFFSNTAVEIYSSYNFEISNLSFQSTLVTIQSGSNVTITNCTFSGPGLGGVQSYNSATVTVTNTNFFGQSGIQIRSATYAFVINNQFTNTWNYTIMLNSVVYIEIEYNTLVNTASNYGIYANGIVYGNITDNVIRGGTMNSGIYLITGSNPGNTVRIFGNLVSGFTSSSTCSQGATVYGFYIVNGDVHPPLIFSNNRAENIYGGCPVYMHGMYVVGYLITQMDNNTVSNFSSSIATQTGPITTIPPYSGISMSSIELGAVISNTTIANFHIGSPGTYPFNILAGLSFNFANLSIDGLMVKDISVGNTFGSNDSFVLTGNGQSVIGIASQYGFSGNNIYISDLTAGNGGDFPNTVPGSFYNTTGGSAIGVQCVLGGNVALNNATFKNLIAGEGGFYDSKNSVVQGTCQGGIATYYQNLGAAAEPGVQYFSELEVFYMLDGVGCQENQTVGPPLNIQVTPRRTSYTISWVRPTTANPNPITFVVDQLTSSAADFSNIFSGPSLDFTSSNLTTNTTYWVRLASVQDTKQSKYINFVITTLPLSPPTQPTIAYKEYTKTTVSLTWSVLDDGGAPVQYYTLQIQNSSSLWMSIYNGSATSFKAGGLKQGSTYQFQVAATNQLGQGAWSYSSTITTPTDICGDGSCDANQGETCSSCSLDCGSCGYQPCPGTPQCSGGTCTYGICVCPSGKSGPACEFSTPQCTEIHTAFDTIFQFK